MIKPSQVLSLLKMKRERAESSLSEQNSSTESQKSLENKQKENKEKFIKVVESEIKAKMPPKSKYTDFNFLDDGGFSYIFTCKRLGKKVCVKYIPKCKLKRSTLKRVELSQKHIKLISQAEATAMAELEFQNSIKHIETVKLADNSLMFAIEYCSLGTLDDLLENGFKDSLNRVTDHVLSFILTQCINYLSYLRCANFLHNDIKPANILIDDNLNLKFADYGLSERVDLIPEEVDFCDSGTVCFLAPEKIKRLMANPIFYKKYSYKSDIWATGVMLYCLAFGRFPYKISKKDDKQTVLSKIEANQLELAKNDCLVKEYFNELAKLLKGMLEPDISRRMTIVEIMETRYAKRGECIYKQIRAVMETKSTAEKIELLRIGTHI